MPDTILDRQMPFDITYILCTRNRLSYLKILEKEIFDKLEFNEELVVVDGASTDGSAEFLHNLYQKGQIHQYISEPDINQAHGWNKALLMARGKVIKKIIDDDVFCLNGIRRCRDHMLTHQDVDICISEGMEVYSLFPEKLIKTSRLPYFLKWKNGEMESFTFSDAYILIRKSSLSYIGLFDTQFAMMDWEFSLRCSYLQANMCYYTGFTALSVHTPGNVTARTDKSRKKIEGRIGKLKYCYAGDDADMPLLSKIKVFLGKIIYRNIDVRSNDSFININLEESYSIFYQKINEFEWAEQSEFIHK